MAKINVVFIGGLSNGKVAYEYLRRNQYVNLQLVVTYPNESLKPRHIPFEKSANIVHSNSANDYLDKINSLNPDLIIVVGWSELLKQELIDLPKLGTIGFHPSKLPLDRGRSVLAWQISEGYVDTALTMFYYSDFPDGGDIIGQDFIKIRDNDYINDLLDKIDRATLNLIKAFFPLIRKGICPRKKQELNSGSFRRLRTNEDSLIDWNQDSKDIYNLVRAISKPYPGAIGNINGIQYRIWRTTILESFPIGFNEKPGICVAKFYDDTLLIRTRSGYIKIIEYSKLN